jgi:predicted acetyltransferase
VELAPASRAEAPILANLLELYLYEFSDVSQRDVGEEGRFGYRSLYTYWTAAGRYPFLIRVDGALAGFALALDRNQIDPGEPGYAVAEFFVLRKFRRRGVGRAAASALFDRLPGRWWVAEHIANPAAQAFWRAVIGGYTGGTYWDDSWELAGERGVAQTFDAPARKTDLTSAEERGAGDDSPGSDPGAAGPA